MTEEAPHLMIGEELDRNTASGILLTFAGNRNPTPAIFLLLLYSSVCCRTGGVSLVVLVFVKGGEFDFLTLV